MWIHLRKDRFPKYRQNKLLPRADGPFKIQKNIGDNAYKIPLPHTYGISDTFNIGDLSKYEGNTELGTILLEERENDPNMDQTRAKTSQEAKTHQPTELRTTDLHSDLSMATNLHSDLSVTIQEGQLQSRPKSSIKGEQRQEESRINLTATCKQGSSLHQDQQIVEQQTAEKPTLHSMENPIYCVGKRENLGNDIFIHGPRSQGPRTLLVVLTEATK